MCNSQQAVTGSVTSPSSCQGHLLSSARWRPMLLNTARMRIMARRTPHLNRASGLEATRWWKNDCLLLRRSDTTSGCMCSLFSCWKSCRSKRIDIRLETFFLADRKRRRRTCCTAHFLITLFSDVWRGGGSSINHSLFTEVFKDFPRAAYLTRPLQPLTTWQLQGCNDEMQNNAITHL